MVVTDMDIKQLDYTDDCIAYIVDNLFELNDTMYKDLDSIHAILDSFFECTPISVTKLLLLQGITIEFRNQDFFTKSKNLRTIGMYNNANKIITISSDIPLNSMISTLHHEIGHAVDWYVSSMLMLKEQDRKRFSSKRGRDISDLKDEEGYIHNLDYHKSKSSEFFAQSYSEYVRNTNVLEEWHETKKLFDSLIYNLNSYFEIATSDDLKEYTKSKYPIYILSDGRFVYERKNKKNPSAVDILLYDEDTGFKTLLKNQNPNYQTYRNELCDDEVIISSQPAKINSDCKKNDYLLKGNSLYDLGGMIYKSIDRYGDYVNYKSFLVIDSNNMKNIIYKKDGEILKKTYEFNSYKDTLRKYDTIIGVGIKDNTISFIDQDLNINRVTEGNLLDITTSHILGYSDELMDTNLFVIENNGLITIEDDFGDVIITCKKYRTLLLPKANQIFNQWCQLDDEDDEYYDDEYYDDEYYDDCIGIFEELIEAVFIEYDDVSQILYTDGTTLTVDYEDIGFCSNIALSDSSRIITSINSYFEDIMEYKIKLDGKWHYSIDSVDLECITESDDLYTTISGINSELYFIGINYNDINSTKLTRGNIKSAEVISQFGNVIQADMSYDDLIKFLEELKCFEN